MVIPSLIRKAYEKDTLVVWGDGTPIRDFIHAHDVARGMIHVVENKITKPMNLGSGTGHTIEAVAEAVSDYFDVPTTWDVCKPSGDKQRILCMDRAKSYGFEPTISLREGITSTCDWFVKNKDTVDDRYNAFK